MDHQIGSQAERLLQVRRGEGVVDHQPGAPGSCATAATAAMSTMDSVGLEGVSTQTRRVSGRQAAATAAGSWSGTGVWVRPSGPHTLSISRKVPP